MLYDDVDYQRLKLQELCSVQASPNLIILYFLKYSKIKENFADAAQIDIEYGFRVSLNGVITQMFQGDIKNGLCLGTSAFLPFIGKTINKVEISKDNDMVLIFDNGGEMSILSDTSGYDDFAFHLQ
jgi:hypothetical protein